jgi:hypothetical protein
MPADPGQHPRQRKLHLGQQARTAPAGKPIPQRAGQLRDRHRRTDSLFGALGIRSFGPAIQGELAGVTRGWGQIALQIAHHQVGQIEGTLARHRDIGGQDRVAADAGELQAMRPGREEWALEVMNSLVHVGV